MVEWIIISALGWLLCGAWAIRMWEKRDYPREVMDNVQAIFTYVAAPVILVVFWFMYWTAILSKFAEGVCEAWLKALKQAKK